MCLLTLNSPPLPPVTHDLAQSAARLLIVFAVILPTAAPPIDVAHERARVLKAADQYLKERPVTITAFRAARSAGGPHDYFSKAAGRDV